MRTNERASEPTNEKHNEDEKKTDRKPWILSERSINERYYFFFTPFSSALCVLQWNECKRCDINQKDKLEINRKRTFFSAKYAYEWESICLHV